MQTSTVVLRGLVMWLIVVVAFLIYVLTVNSSGVFTVNRHFWKITGIALGLALLISGLLYLFLHVNYLLSAMIALIAACVVHAGVEQEQKEDEGSVGVAEDDPLALTETEDEDENEQWKLTSSFEEEF